MNERPRVSRAEVDLLRATLHRLARQGVAAAEDHVRLRQQLRGRVEWAAAGEPARRAKLERLFSAIVWPDQ